MHFKAINATLTSGEFIAAMIFARALALLPLPTGHLTWRTWQSGGLSATSNSLIHHFTAVTN
ncbi:hypothetical protein FHW67_000803 [Herbaspirillum sp. Sphag1AN]|uniref:hypothetical protein n=1 Tax=unclassified Herbaspirillum TaxID=2624150 RepID=UPI001616A045|nr:MULTISPECIES: hypothetical protein [unclassified Herbaspirillum]MBB3211555.1 hypothetical protein [Herbaspirillum sp. Sphag1AN]MBB3245178.1 hypothetical protein [Herbaspirillum sp. Sphag64]